MIDMNRERLLSINAAAQHLGVSRQTICNWFRRGLDRAKLGGRVFTSREAIQRFSIQNSPLNGAGVDADRRAAVAFQIPAARRQSSGAAMAR
jgi:hypothetical protein